MKIPFITINYDKYWKQIVVGLGKIDVVIPKIISCYASWRRLFAIGKPKKKGE